MSAQTQQTPQTESETTQQPLFRVTARQLQNGDTLLSSNNETIPGAHMTTSSMPQSMSLVDAGAGAGANGRMESLVEQDEEGANEQDEVEKGDTQPGPMRSKPGAPSQRPRNVPTWRTYETPPSAASLALGRTDGDHNAATEDDNNAEDSEVDQLDSSSMPAGGEEEEEAADEQGAAEIKAPGTDDDDDALEIDYDDAPEVQIDGMDAPEVSEPADTAARERDLGPIVETPPESASPKPLFTPRKSRRTPAKDSPKTNGQQPISHFVPSPAKASPRPRRQGRQSSVPAPVMQHTPFKTSRAFARSKSDRAGPFKEDDGLDESFADDGGFLNPRQRVERLAREGGQGGLRARSRALQRKTSAQQSEEGSQGGATDTEEQHDSHTVSQSLQEIPNGNLDEIDEEFAQMETNKRNSSPSANHSGLDSPSLSPTAGIATRRLGQADDSQEESESNRNLFDTLSPPPIKAQRFDFPSTAESSRLDMSSQLATTSEKGFGPGEESLAEPCMQPTQLARGSANPFSSPSKEADTSPVKSTSPLNAVVEDDEVVPTPRPFNDKARGPANNEDEPELGEDLTTASSIPHLAVRTPISPSAAAAAIASIPQSRRLTRSRPPSSATTDKGASHVSIPTSARSEVHSNGTPKVNINGTITSTGSKVSASRTLKRRNEKSTDPDAALYGTKSPYGSHSKITKMAIKTIGDVEATQIGTQVGTLPNEDTQKDGDAAPDATAVASISSDTASARPVDDEPLPIAKSGKVVEIEPTLTDAEASLQTPHDIAENTGHVNTDGQPAPQDQPAEEEGQNGPIQTTSSSSSLAQPAPSSSQGEPSVFKPATLNTSPPPDDEALPDQIPHPDADVDAPSGPSTRRTLEVPPVKSPPKHVYGAKAQTRVCKSTARALEGREQSQERKAAKKRNLKRVESVDEEEEQGDADMEPVDGAEDDQGPADGVAEAADVDMDGQGAEENEDSNDSSSMTTVSDREDETFHLAALAKKTKRNSRRRVTTDDDDDDEPESDGAEKAAEKGKRVDKGQMRTKRPSAGKSKQPTPKKPTRTAANKTPNAVANRQPIVEEEDGYVSPETFVDQEDSTFRPTKKTGPVKRKRVSTTAGSSKVGGSTRDSSATTERAAKRPKHGRLEGSGGGGEGSSTGRVAVNGMRDDEVDAVPDGQVAGPAGDGMRVIARWSGSQHFVGLLGERVGDKYEIHFDDKTDGKVSAQNIRLFKLRQGDHISTIRTGGKVHVVAEDYIDDGRPVRLTTKDGETLEFSTAVIYVTSKFVASEWSDRLANIDIGDDTLPEVGDQPVAMDDDAGASTEIFATMRFLLTVDEDASGALSKQDLKQAISGGGGKVVEDWKDLFDLPEAGNGPLNGFGSTLKKGGPVFCVVSGAQSTKPKALIALAAGIPCVAAEWVVDVQADPSVDWRSYLVCAGTSEQLNRDVSQIIDPSYAAPGWDAKKAQNPRQPFTGKKILFVSPKDSDFGPVKRLVPVCLHALGARTFKQVGSASAGEDLSAWDYVLLETRDAAMKRNKVPLSWRNCERVVNTGWLKQCIIMGAALPPSGFGFD